MNERVVIVEDDVELGGLLRSACAVGRDAVLVTTFAAACREIERGCRIVVADLCLPDGSGLDVLRRAQRVVPSPLLVAMSGKASPAEAFAAAQAGARAYLTKPVSGATLVRALDELSKRPPDVPAKDLVGTRVLSDALHDVRLGMLTQALGLTRGNRTHAAQLLGVTRQAVQKMIADLGPIF